MKIYAVVSNYEVDRFLISTFLDKKHAEYGMWEYLEEIEVSWNEIEYYDEEIHEVRWRDESSDKIYYVRIEDSKINPYSCEGKNLLHEGA